MLVKRFGLVEENVDLFHHYGVHLYFFNIKFQVFSGKVIMGSIPVLFPELHAVGQLKG